MLSKLAFTAFLTATLPLAAHAATHDINVGNNNQDITNLVFTPSTTAAAVGDTLVFHFYPGNHNVVQGTYSNPCQPLAGGFYSGFINSPVGQANRTFNVAVKDTEPIWLYCSETEHCQLGMVGVVNPPATGDSLEAYAAAAKNATGDGTPQSVGGGVISTSGEAAPSSSSASSASSASSISSATSVASAPATTTVASSTSSASSSSTTSASAVKSSSAASGLEAGKGVVPSAIGAVLALALAWAGLV